MPAAQHHQFIDNTFCITLKSYIQRSAACPDILLIAKQDCSHAQMEAPASIGSPTAKVYILLCLSSEFFVYE